VTETAKKSFKEATVLIVDDFGHMRTMLRKALERMDFREILEAGNGADASILMESNRVDLIISDWDMPGLDGLALLKDVRSKDAAGSIPFLMITAKPNKELILEAVRANVDSFLVKPFLMATLIEKVAEILGL